MPADLPPSKPLKTFNAHIADGISSLKSNVWWTCASALLYLICCATAARMSLRGLGETSSSFSGTIVLALFLIYFCASRKTYWYVIFPSSLFAMLYSPFGYVYGYPDYQGIISILATNLDEGSEFLSLIPGKIYLRSALVPILCLIAYLIAKKSELRPWKNKTLTLASLATVVVLAKPTQFFDSLFGGLTDVKKAQSELLRYVNHATWGKSITEQENKDYVLVIGESARRDYLNLYGYPLDNTPFLAKNASTIVNGLTAGGVYTVGSLTNMLTVPNKNTWSPNYDRNLIDLAKSAGIRTVWLSNQGYIGNYDTPVSAIGSRADDVQFLNKQEYSRVNLSDYELLKLLEARLNEPQTGKRLIVLHTLGSHPDACRRIADMKDPYKVTDEKLNYIACYASTIKKTDDFLARLYQSMKTSELRSHREFSIIYFSDHGQHHIQKPNGKIDLENTTPSKFHYDIPLVKIDSTHPATLKRINSRKSGLNFTEGIADWMGIRNDKLQPYSLFDGQSDSQDYGLKDKINAIPSPEDPAIDISNVLKTK